MKRIAIKLVIFLLLGAVVNVAVAWGCAVYSAGLFGTYKQDMNPEWISWFRRVAPYPVESESWAESASGFGVAYIHIEATSDSPVPGLIDRRIVDVLASVTECGWPFLCLRDIIWAERRGSWLKWPGPAWSPARGRLGSEPISPGFLINTLFYAVILWLLWSTPFATRRLIRKRRGRCVKCGYDLTGTEHEVCPECGQ